MYIVRLGIILMLIAGVAAGGLSLLNNQTAPIIAEYKAKQQAEARQEVSRSLGATSFEQVLTEDGYEYFKALNDDGQLVGYVTLAYGKGYSSTIETIAGYDTSFSISGLKITFQQETPGLGTKAVEVHKGESEPWFLRQFKEKDGLNVAVKQDRGQIDAITGATITARAVAVSVKEAARKIKTLVESEVDSSEDAVMEDDMAANPSNTQDGED
ncbi:FMN-binding protein [bacterium]|nr:FMN-binding protein [bacterium]